MAEVKMPRDVAIHETAHMIASAIAWLGNDSNPYMKHFYQHPRFNDATAWVGFDAATGQGEYAVVAGQFSKDDSAVLGDRQLAEIRRASALAPIGLARDQRRISKALGEAKHVIDMMSGFDDLLSPEDRAVVMQKGLPLQLTRPEQIVGVHAYAAAQAVCPRRLDGIVSLLMKHGGTGGSVRINEFIPRNVAADICAEAMRNATLCFAVAA
jgi:hypothetical protein